MAKGARDFKAEYARRIANALKKGKTRQQARGHRPQEHIARREREIAEEGITKAQTRIVFNWAANRLYQIKDHEIEATDVVTWAQEVGYDAFKQYRHTWEAARRQYKREVRNGSYASRGLGYLQMLADNAGVDELSWLYYH